MANAAKIASRASSSITSLRTPRQRMPPYRALGRPRGRAVPASAGGPGHRRGLPWWCCSSLRSSRPKCPPAVPPESIRSSRSAPSSGARIAIARPFVSSSDADDGHTRGGAGHPLSHFAGPSRLGRDASGPGLLRGLRHPAYRSSRRSLRPWPGVHARSRHRALRRRRARARAHRHRRDARVDRGRHGGLLAATDVGLAAPMDRAGKRRHPSVHRGRRERGVGLVGEGRAEAALETARRHDAGGARRLHRLPLHHRRDHSRAKRWRSCATAQADGLRAKPRSRATDIPRTRHPSGWFGYPRRSARPMPAGHRRRLVALQDQGRRRPATTTGAARRSCAQRSVRTAR